MPWYAQHAAGHPNYADPGSDLEAVLRRLDYVEVAAPGADEPGETSSTDASVGASAEAETGAGKRATVADVKRGHGGPVDDAFGG